MTQYIFGANTLENLTTAMYKDSKIIYREYIQNACDQIDEAVENNVLKSGQGCIEIWINRDKRTISIEDNATGISASKFEKTLSYIADSDKKIGKNKGFRGIGRLCGLAYCEKLVFSSSAKGENVVSILSCDAKKMRKLIDDNSHGHKHSADEILNAINEFRTEETKDTDSHFFKVELCNINIENTDLLEQQAVKDYLSFVAPVPYQNTFIYRNKVYEHAKKLRTNIDEYAVKVEGEPIFKKYSTILKESTGAKYDDIFDIAFEDIYDSNGKLIAWLWYGLSQFSKAIPNSKSKPVNEMRGIRLRKENIQIGEEDALQKLFKEDRGNSYFVGEVFAVSDDLVPNSRRDYFNENSMRVLFEQNLQKYFNKLYKIYHEGSTINSDYKKINDYEKKSNEYRKSEAAGNFVNNEHKESEFKKVQQAKEIADKAQAEIAKKSNELKSDDVLAKIVKRIKNNHESLVKNEQPDQEPLPDVDKKHPWKTEKLTEYNRKEKKLIAKIFGIILNATDKDTADMIINKIEEELK